MNWQIVWDLNLKNDIIQDHNSLHVELIIFGQSKSHPFRYSKVGLKWFRGLILASYYAYDFEDLFLKENSDAKTRQFVIYPGISSC